MWCSLKIDVHKSDMLNNNRYNDGRKAERKKQHNMHIQFKYKAVLQER